MKAGDLMTKGVATVGPDDTLTSVVTLMTAKGISGLPVVDASGAVIGMVTESDLLSRWETGSEPPRRARWLEFILGVDHEAGEYVHSHSRVVADLMTPHVYTVEQDTPLSDAVALMRHHHIHRLPVVDQGKLVGILSRSDFVRALAQRLTSQPVGAVTDAEIEARLNAELHGKSWFLASNVTMVARDGVVTLKGLVFDDRSRDALRVAAENVPGVKWVDDQLVWVEPMSGAVMPS